MRRTFYMRLLLGIIAVLTIAVVSAFLLVSRVPQAVPDAGSALPTQVATSQQPQATPAVRGKPIVSSPLPGANVGASFIVSGKAPGPWYFEASFPVQVRDADNNKIGQGIAQAQGDWMTEAMVPFRASVSTSGYTGPATLVLLKDNPSGLPENDDSFEVPIVIK